MMIVAALLTYAVALSYLGSRVLSRAWIYQRPGAGLLAWHVVVSTAMVSVIGAALVASHDIWEPFATLVFRADPESVHHQYVGSAIVGHAWNAAVIVVGVLGLRLLLVAVMRRRKAAAARDDLRAAVHALNPRRLSSPVDDVVVVAIREPTAFCVPGKVPMIVVSDSAMDVLSSQQLAAVVAHERAHLTHWHTTGSAWATAVATTFPRWRLARTYASVVPRLHEMQADDIAAKANGGYAVVTSLVALSGMEAVGSLPMAGGHIRERGLRLLVPSVQRNRLLVLVAGGVAAVALVPTLLLVAPGLAVAGSDHHREFSHGSSVPHP